MAFVKFKKMFVIESCPHFRGRNTLGTVQAVLIRGVSLFQEYPLIEGCLYFKGSLFEGYLYIRGPYLRGVFISGVLILGVSLFQGSLY